MPEYRKIEKIFVYEDQYGERVEFVLDDGSRLSHVADAKITRPTASSMGEATITFVFSQDVQFSEPD